MKNTFRIIIASIAVLAASALVARAEVGAVNFLSAGTVTNDTTRTTGFTDVKIENQSVVGLQVNMAGSQAGTGNVILTLARSKDGLTFETTPRFTVTNALNGTTAVIGYADISEQAQSAHSLRLISAQNADASASATNVTISVVLKRTR